MKEARKLSRVVEPIPEGHHTITSYLVARGADKAIEFYKKAFGAELLDRLDGPDGKTVMHSCLQIGDSRFFLTDEALAMGTRSPEGLGGSPVAFYLYVKDADRAFRKALEAGAKEKEPLMDAFWGDRCGTVTDPFGYHWSLATHIEDVPPSELKKRAQEFFRKMGEKPEDIE